MPNLIKPSQLKENIPEETDTVAKALLKYLKFTITFWRWFKGVVKSDGQLTDDFKQQLCGLGCGGKPVVPDEDEVPPDDTNPDDNDKPPVTKPPVQPGSNCCKAVIGKGNDSFTWWNVKGARNDKAYIDLKCYDGIRYAVVKNHGHDVSFNSNKEFSEVFESMPGIMSGGGKIDGNPPVALPGTGASPPLVGIGTSPGDRLLWNTWPHLEILIWGYTPKLTDNKGYHNHHLVGNIVLNGKREEPFLMKNNGYWMSRIVLVDLRNVLDRDGSSFDADYFTSNINLRLDITTTGGEKVYDTKGNMSIDLNYDRHFPESVKSGERLVNQNILTKIAGIRMTVFNASTAAHLLHAPWGEGNSTPLPYEVSLYRDYNWVNALTLFEERWLDEPERCMWYNKADTKWKPERHLHFLWRDHSSPPEQPFLNPSAIQTWYETTGNPRGNLFYDNYTTK